MPPMQLSLSGPALQRAGLLAHESVTSLVHGGPAAEGALEVVLTEATNNREIGATLTLVLAQISATLARLVAELEDGPVDDESVRERTLAVIDEITSGFSGSAN
jgi:hypothetical protein